MPNIDFLPDEIEYEGDWDDFIGALYEVFHHDFIASVPKIGTSPIFVDRKIIDSDKEEGFWHLVQKTDRKSGERFPEFGRASKVPWVKPIIENHDSEHILSWHYDEGNGRTRLYLWAENDDYVVILEKKRNIYFLVTGFKVDGNWKQKDLKKKYDNRIME